MHPKQNEIEAVDDIDQSPTMPTETFTDDADDVITDAAMQAFEGRVAARRRQATVDYWAALQVLAVRDKLSSSERDQQFDKLDDIRLLIAKSEQDVREDFDALRNYIVAHDMVEQSPLIEAEISRRRDALKALQVQIAALNRQLDEKQKEDNAGRERVQRVIDQLQRAGGSQSSCIHRLKQRGLASVDSLQSLIGSAPKSGRASKWRFERLSESMANMGFDLATRTWIR